MIKGNHGGPRKWKNVLIAVVVLLAILFGLWMVSAFLNRAEFFQGGAEAPKKVVVNYYYLEKCPFCIQFDPEWQKFVTLSAGKIETNKIDGTKQSVYKSFPTIEIIEAGSAPREYTGERKATAMMDYLSSAE